MSLDAHIVSPWFLDGVSPAARQLIRPSDTTIEVEPAAGDKIEAVAPVHRALAAAVGSAIEGGMRPLAIIGDCCQTIPIVAALHRRGMRPTVVWLDSHGDFNTWDTTPSGFLGGMPLAMLTGRGDQRMLQAVGMAPITDSEAVLSDARDLDPGERTLLSASSVRHVPTVHELMSVLPDGPLYLHFDSDIIDAAEAPAFLYPVTGGPTAGQMRDVLAMVMATGRVVAASVTVGWDATSADAAPTARAVMAATAALGR